MLEQKTKSGKEMRLQILAQIWRVWNNMHVKPVVFVMSWVDVCIREAQITTTIMMNELTRIVNNAIAKDYAKLADKMTQNATTSSQIPGLEKLHEELKRQGISRKQFLKKMPAIVLEDGIPMNTFEKRQTALAKHFRIM